MTAVETVTIRRATVADAPGIITVLDTVAREDLMLADPGSRTVAQEHQVLAQSPPWMATWVCAVTTATGMSIVGTSEAVQGQTAKTQGVVTVSLALLPTARGCGWGRQLMEAMEAWAIERHARKISLLCLSHNHAAMAFYDHLGYQEEARLRAHYYVGARWVDVVWLTRWLSPAQP